MRAALALALACAWLLCATAAGSPPPVSAPLDSDGYRLAVPPYTFAFPRDHASHPQFRTEWWYYTGHLAAGGRRFGYELTFFRVGLPRVHAATHSAWAVHDLMFVHAALTDEAHNRFLYRDEVLRPALGLAGADSTRYRVWLGDSRAELAPDGRTHALHAAAPGFALALALEPGKAPAVHGERGVSQKTSGAGNASQYYSLTRMATEGTLALGTDTLAVTGTSWMDHEFGSSSLMDGNAGWDWFSVQLDDGRELMLYALRRSDGSIEPLSAGSLIERDGRVRHLARSAFRITARGRWTSPHTGAVYPSGWRLELPGDRLDLEVTPRVRDQELIARAMGGIVYWEGSCSVQGTSRGTPVVGEAYAELTGYAKR